jgi:excisionase family DNA binding protein
MTDELQRTVTIGEAAKLLNVHRNTVRNRIKAGRYNAHKVVTPQGETYSVTLESLSQDVPGSYHNPSQPPVHNNSIQDAQLQSVTTVDQQDAVVHLVQQMLIPFVQELGETREELGRVRAERDALQSRLTVLQAQHAESLDEPTNAPETRTQRVWWQFWRD